MRYLFQVVSAAALVSLVACGDKTPTQTAAPAAPSTESAAAPVPDAGKLENVKVAAIGLGATPGEAMSEALKMALLQVNGAVMQSSTVSVKYGLDIALDKDSVSLRASEFAEAVKQRSGGVITSLKVLELQEPSLITGKRYKASIEAEVAKFKPSADMQKLKVVVGPVRFERASLPMGDRSIPSAEVAAIVRQRISDALVQTGRFAVLDRDFSPEIAQELELLSSGQAPSAELAKMSQAASADLVWSARVSDLAYNRHARQLKTSDRELVSYSGGWALSQKLVNVATRQVVTSDSLQGSAPSTEPTTLGAGVDGNKVLGDMTDELVNKVVASILLRTFPVTVVALDGTNVVLSQGGQALREGARYSMVRMGTEMKDPQTGQSLGRMESPCCDLIIDRVTPNLSYGHLENVKGSLEDLPPAGLQLRAEVKSGKPSMPVALAPAATPKPGKSASVPSAVTAASEPHPAAASTDSEKW